MTDGLEVMFDGISLQHVGELLLDEPRSTRAIRRLCFKSYYASLKDFAFAAIFGSKIVTCAPLPEVREGTPGETLLSAKHFGAKHSRRTSAIAEISPNWESLLDNEEDRGVLEALVTSLGQLDPGKLAHWRHEVIRDIFLYLGSDPSLAKPNRRDDYRFEGRGNFRRDERLQAKVPLKHRTQVLREVRRQAGELPDVRAAHDDAIDEFVCRNVVAHVGIYHWYCRVGEKSLHRQKGLRIPHATRQALPAVEHSLWTVKELTTPGLLEVMLAGSRTREELRDKIIEASEDTVYDSLREKLAEAWQLSAWGRTNEMDKIRADIETEIYGLRNPQIGHVVIASGKEDALYRDAIRMLAIRSTPSSIDKVASRRVFSELSDER
jgi:hypothetical protein